MITLYIISALCLLSIGFNVYLVYKELKKSKTQQKDRDLQLIQDLMTHGRSIIKITRVAPSDCFIRSPRDIQ